MNRTALVVSERKQDYPILIVDKTGNIGEKISDELSNESLVVYVSQKNPEVKDNVIHIPYIKKFPTIPDNTYSYIFIIDEQAHLTKELLNSFVKKAQKDNSYLIIAFNKNYVSEELLKNISSSYKNIKVAVFGDIFAKDFIYNKNSEINKFILQAKTLGTIGVPGDGTRDTYPVYLEDVVSGILETVFGDHNDKWLFYIFPKHGLTLLSLAHMFQKNDPNLRVDFTKNGQIQQNNFVFPPEGVYMLGDSYNLSERIKEIKLTDIKINEIQEEPIYREKKGNNFGYLSIVIFLIILALMPLIATVAFSSIGLASLYAVKNDIEKGNLSSSKNSAVFASKSFGLSQASSVFFLEEANILGQEDKAQSFIDKVNLGSDISDAALSLIDASDRLKSVLTGTSSNPSFDFSTATIELKNALFIYDKEKQSGIIPSTIIQKLDDLTNLASSTVDFWPDILGLNGQKTYLILFQNNMELRPGGGFIGSYALLTLKTGQTQSFKIYDVYDADGQLKGHVEPPYPIRRYLPSVHWYLRDSNFNVDFSQGAVASAVFLNTEMHQTVDGVIGVDLSFVKNLLSVVGPVNVSDYNQIVNADNFFQVAQTYAEKDFFPGSTQKKDFLRSFFNALEIKLSSSKDTSYLNLLQVLSGGVYEKHVLLAFNNVNQQAAFAINGWSSSLVEDRAQNSSTINDFMGINEANLGVDKVNYYISRSLSQDISVDSNGNINEDLTVTLKNSAPKNAWTGGLYKNYLRVILPYGAKISGIQIDGKDQKIVPAITDPTVYEKKGFLPPSGLEVQGDNQGQNTIYGFLIILQPGDLRTIKVGYTLAKKVDFSNPDVSYSLRIFKQPGIDFYPYNLSLSFPNTYKAINPSPGVNLDNQKATLVTQIIRDQEVNVNFVAK